MLNDYAELLDSLTPQQVADLDRLLLLEPPTLAGMVEATTINLYLESWQEIVCDRLERLTHQTGQRLLIHGPPQHGKSILVAQRLPAYLLGINPTARVRLGCYNISHAERFSKVNLDLMRSAEYRGLFPDSGARIPTICPADEWSTVARSGMKDANPSFMALGLGSGFLGVGADYLILDDLYKNAQEARSEAANAYIWDWWTQVVLSRLNPATNIVVMFHRWWENDFAGRLIEQGGWEQMRFPAIADGGVNDPTGRAEGDPLSPRYPVPYLREVEKLQGTAFNALYQGVPYPAGGNMFKAGKVTFIDRAPTLARRVRHWDIGATENDGDYTAGVLMACAEPGIWIVEDVVRGQWDTDERDRIIKETAQLDRKRGPVLQRLPQDPAAAGKSMARGFLRLLAGYSVKTVIESGDKVTRADPLASQWNAQNIRLVTADWNTAYLNEMCAFPAGKHDDMVDAAAGAFDELTIPVGGIADINYDTLFSDDEDDA